VLLAAGAIALWTLGSADLVLVALGMLRGHPKHRDTSWPGTSADPAAMFGVLPVLTVTAIVTTLAL